MLRNGLRKLANRLEEKEEREKLKFQAAASLTDSEKERVRTRQENRQKRRVALKQWTKRTIGVGVVFVAKVLKDGKEE
jgi:F0F1-type ATP synthase delta subunit